MLSCTDCLWMQIYSSEYLVPLLFYILYSRVQGTYHAPQSTVAVPLTLVLVLSMKLPVCGTVMNKLHQAVYGAGNGCHLLHQMVKNCRCYRSERSASDRTSYRPSTVDRERACC